MQKKGKKVENWTVVGFREEVADRCLRRVYVLRDVTSGRLREMVAADRAEVASLLAEEARKAEKMVSA